MASKICFLVGHGKSNSSNYDSGAVSKCGKYHEFRIAKEIAKYAQSYYNANYAEQADLMNYEGNLTLSDRIKKVNASNYDFIAEIHLNAGGGTGTECYYAKNSTKGKKYADQICKQISADLEVKQRSNGKDDGGDKVKLTSSGNDYFGIVRQTNPPAVLVETVFIDTTSDLAKVKTAEGQKKCGVAIAKAVATVRGAKKKTAEKPETTEPATTSNPTASKANTTSKTNNLVKEWQKAAIADGYKFPEYGADGIWGSECESVAKKAICKKPLIKGLYSKKNLTKFLQKQLGIESDGKFWKDTYNAVVAFQKKNKLTADGIVGLNTWEKLLKV